jgi:hypothetical protein
MRDCSAKVLTYRGASSRHSDKGIAIVLGIVVEEYLQEELGDCLSFASERQEILYLLIFGSLIYFSSVVLVYVDSSWLI